VTLTSGGNFSALAEQPVEVWCQCDPELAARRYNDRARTCHPIHVQASGPPDVRAEYGIGKLVTVDTAIPVDVVAVAAAVREAAAGLEGGGYCSRGVW
jgi:hypothetical protein